MRREQCPNRVVEDEIARHPPARQQGVAQHSPLENLDQRCANLALLFQLTASVLDPDRRLFDKVADVNDREGGQYADPQHAAPPDIVAKHAPDHARQQEADTPRALQHPAHKAAGADRPLLHRQRRAGRPLGPHADAQQGAEHQQKQQGRRKSGDEIADRIPEDRNHQRRLAPDPIGEPAGRDRTDQPHPQRQREDPRDLAHRDAELIGDWLHDQQKDGEIECIQGPAEPRRPPGVPLILGRLLPPRDGMYDFPRDCRHNSLLLEAAP